MKLCYIGHLSGVLYAVYDENNKKQYIGTLKECQSLLKVRYECYVDYIQKILQCVFPTLREAREWKKEGSKDSEQWIVKVDQNGNRKEVR